MDDFKTDLKGIQNKLMSPSMSAEWHKLKERIQDFMNTTRRTWGNAIFYLLEKGLEQHERDERVTGRHKQTDE